MLLISAGLLSVFFLILILSPFLFSNDKFIPNLKQQNFEDLNKTMEDLKKIQTPHPNTQRFVYHRTLDIKQRIKFLQNNG